MSSPREASVLVLGCAAALAVGTLLWRKVALAAEEPAVCVCPMAPAPTREVQNKFMAFEDVEKEILSSTSGRQLLMQQEQHAGLHQCVSVLLSQILLAQHDTWTPEVGTGAAGTAFALWKHWHSLSSSSLHSDPTINAKDELMQKNRDQLLKKAKEVIETALVHPSLANRETRGSFPQQCCGFMFGEPGIYMVAALVFNSSGDTDMALIMADNLIQQFALLKASEVTSDQYYGLAGYLSCCTTLLEHLSLANGVRKRLEAIVVGLIGHIVAKGRTRSPGRPLAWPFTVPDRWQMTNFLQVHQSYSWMQPLVPVVWAMAAVKGKKEVMEGMAHGDLGVLCGILKALRILSGSSSVSLDHRKELAAHAEDIRRAVDWHAAAGVHDDLGVDLAWNASEVCARVYLGSEAFAFYGDDSHLSMAKDAAEVLWASGLAAADLSLGRGTAGMGMAFLSLYKACGDSRYAYYADRFAKSIFMEVNKRGEYPAASQNPFTRSDLSLCNGASGVLVFVDAALQEDLRATQALPSFM